VIELVNQSVTHSFGMTSDFTIDCFITR